MKYDIESIKKRKQNVIIIKKILVIIVIVFIYNIILLGISGLDDKKNISFFGLRAYMITTNSMEPNIKINDVIICKRTKEDNIKVGDIITFFKEEKIITHRIIQIDNNGEKKQYITKGDNNEVEDGEKIELEQIQGKLVINIPGLGNLLKALENNIIVLVIILVILICCFIKILINEKKEKRREQRRIEEAKSEKNKIRDNSFL